jgi:hypothetical protein
MQQILESNICKVQVKSLDKSLAYLKPESYNPGLEMSFSYDCVGNH